MDPQPRRHDRTRGGRCACKKARRDAGSMPSLAILAGPLAPSTRWTFQPPRMPSPAAHAGMATALPSGGLQVRHQLPDVAMSPQEETSLANALQVRAWTGRAGALVPVHAAAGACSRHSCPDAAAPLSLGTAQVCDQLRRAGCVALIAGGWVRDKFLGRPARRVGRGVGLACTCKDGREGAAAVGWRGAVPASAARPMLGRTHAQAWQASLPGCRRCCAAGTLTLRQAPRRKRCAPCSCAPSSCRAARRG